MEEKYKSHFSNVNFRDKRYGWKTYGLTLMFKSGKSIRNIFKTNPYGQAFLKNVILRPSCYSCSFKSVERVSDFTAGDFWANKGLMKDDDSGISLILIHTNRGKEIWEKICSKLEWKLVSRDQAVTGNTPLYESVKCPPYRSAFFYDLLKMTFSESTKRHIKYRLTLKQRLLFLAKRIGLK